MALNRLFSSLTSRCTRRRVSGSAWTSSADWPAAGELGSLARQLWIVMTPSTRHVRIETRFVIFRPDASPDYMREWMSRYASASAVNDSAKIAMFHPSGGCTSDDMKECTTAFAQSGTVRRRVMDVFERYVPRPESRQLHAALEGGPQVRGTDIVRSLARRA